MKIAAVICNVVFWGFFCMVMLTDGPPKGIDIVLSLVPFLMPILNVAVIRLVTSPGRNLKRVALVSNILWLGLACWQIVRELPSHPKEEGLLEFAALLALTPMLSAAVICLSLRCPRPAMAR